MSIGRTCHRGISTDYRLHGDLQIMEGVDPFTPQSVRRMLCELMTDSKPEI
jgi:hypothetical protein